jgi:hypothetical protein
MGRYSDYDEDDESPRPRSSGGSNKWILILGIIAGVLFVCILVCGGVVYLIYQGVSSAASSVKTAIEEMQGSQQAAESFMRDIAGNRVDAAYNSTTKDFQTRQTLAQFRDLVNKNPALKNFQPPLMSNNFTPASATFQGNVAGQNGMWTSFTVTVIKDGQTWKVDRFTIP